MLSKQHMPEEIIGKLREVENCAGARSEHG
jgi:hypothetical protein